MNKTKEVQKHNRPLWTQNPKFWMGVHKVVQGPHYEAENDAEDMIWVEIAERFGISPCTADDLGNVLTWVFWPYAEPEASIVVNDSELENVLSFLEVM
jgi:hypothetical protein